MRTFLLTISVDRKIKQVLAVLCFICLVSCKQETKPYSQITGAAQGTTFKIVFESVSEQDYSSSIDSLLKVIDESMSLWDQNSLISRINTFEDTLIIDSHFKKVFERTTHFYNVSEGRFDPTVGPLLTAWGLARKSNLPIPTQTQIDSLLGYVDFSSFELKGNKLQKLKSNIELDFNAIAQGYSVDALGDFLEEKGIKNYLIELGGEIKTKGYNQFKEPWKVGIERPDFNDSDSNNAIQTVVGLSDLSLATSGSYRKYVEFDGKKYSHTIDPRTGWPVNHNLLSVSVITPSAMDADALATMFMVLGKEKALEYANKNDILVQCISDNLGELEVSFSEGFEEILIEQTNN
ncbi:MAG: FAD:protein FMN transferase [Cytophagales bacterium]|nr:FAD:protein FMN transferase [Cytophagales bacterium]